MVDFLSAYQPIEIQNKNETVSDESVARAHRGMRKIAFWYGHEDLEMPCDFCGQDAVDIEEDRHGNLNVFVCESHRGGEYL